MPKKLLLLDRDGTVTRNIRKEGDYILSPDDLGLMPGILPKLEQYANDGWCIAMASNQGHIEKGLISMDTAINTFYRTFKLTRYFIQAAWFCPATGASNKGSIAFRLTMPHGPVTWNSCKTYNNYGYRKPCPGMALAAMAWFGVKPENCLYVGDRLEDKNMAGFAGIRFVHIDRFVEGDFDEVNN